MQLYSDGLHANLTGSYLAALVIYSRIFARTPVGLPGSFKLRNGGSVSMPETLAKFLQESAWAAVQPVLPKEVSGDEEIGPKR
jgi:hypothetical protein